jgi:hypothetical protein
MILSSKNPIFFCLFLRAETSRVPPARHQLPGYRPVIGTRPLVPSIILLGLHVEVVVYGLSTHPRCALEEEFCDIEVSLQRRFANTIQTEVLKHRLPRKEWEGTDGGDG